MKVQMDSGSFSDPKTLKEVLDDLIKSQGWGTKISEQTVPEIWEEVVGELIAKSARITKVSNKKVFIETASSTWRAELMLRSGDIIAKINKHLGAEVVNELIIKLV
ncbi:MAG: DUF721 domain-containing protein [Bacteroidota bacterium]|jgi:predicted nucleic acid-binding Zn ribbon protein